MEFIGRFVSITKDIETNEWRITFTVNDSALAFVEKIKGCEKLSVKAEKYSKRRTNDANALMWHCIQQLASIEGKDKWDVYLDMLKHYGVFSPVTIRADAYESFKTQWRECEIVGEFEQDGIKKLSVLCYFGSHTYTTKEFSRLLDGIKQEMESNGLQPPASEELRRAVEEWESQHQSSQQN